MGWGDEIIVTGTVRRMQEQDGRRVRVLDARGRPRWSAIWEHNPRIAPPGWRRDGPTVVDGPGRRPYIVKETRRQWVWRDWICPVGEIVLSARERHLARAHAGRVVLEPNLMAKASPNKDWGWARWTQLAGRLQARGHEVTQLGPRGIRLLPGARHVETADFREACAVLSGAHLAVLPEGGLHHAAAALGVPSIVLFGGFISPRQTGYPHQLSLFRGGEPCGMRVPCAHCAAAMKAIEVEEVLERGLALIGARRSEPFESEGDAAWGQVLR